MAEVGSLFEEYMSSEELAPITEETLLTPLQIVQMAIGLIPTDLRYDFNGDGRVTTFDSRMLSLDPSLGQALIQPVTPTYDPSNIDLSLLENLDLSNLDLESLNNLTWQNVSTTLTGTAPTPASAQEYANLYQNQVNALTNTKTLEGVPINDRPYAYNYAVASALGDNPLANTTLDEFKAAAGIPQSFSIYDSGQGINQQTAQDAYALLAGAEDPIQALSQYYGIDIQRTSNPDANYNNASKYGSDATNMAEFQSIIEPVLQKVIPYIQLTKGLRYDDALEYAYRNDPMISALYNQYGVDLFRQTSDGSTYFFDPISGSEARTVEVKDTSFRDVG